MRVMTEHAAVRVSIETDSADEIGRAVNSGLYAYNDQFAGPMENSMLAIGARDPDNKIIGGLVANLQPGWKWMTVLRLWMEESHRRAGIGRRLIEIAEARSAEIRMPACRCRHHG